MYQMTPTERDLIDAANDIGRIVDGNCHWSIGLARLVAKTGKRVDDLTVGELRRLIAQRTVDYNRIYGAVK